MKISLFLCASVFKNPSAFTLLLLRALCVKIPLCVSPPSVSPPLCVSVLKNISP